MHFSQEFDIVDGCLVHSQIKGFMGFMKEAATFCTDGLTWRISCGFSDSC